MVHVATHTTPRGLRWSRWTLADRVTFARALLVAGCAGLVVAGPVRGERAWAFVAVAGVALGLDGVDGRVARRRGEASAFGARFDMETDAVLVLVLAVAVWAADRAGAWVLAAGAMRYAFGAAGRLWPALRRPLPPRWSRQAVAAWQGIALTAALAPVVPDAVAAALAASALGTLTWSFGRDVITLFSGPRGAR